MSGRPLAVLEAPLRVPNARQRVGDALWLYVSLVASSNPRGLVVRRADLLADSLSINEQLLNEWLVKLADTRLIEIQSPSPYLVIRLRFWPGASANRPEDGDPHREVPVGSAAAAAAEAATSKREDGGAGEGGALLRDAIAVIGAADPDEVARLVSAHPESVVLQALSRVEATPGTQIRKSKLALFRYLLGKLS